MNSETDKPTPPRRFNKRRNDTSVTPAIGDSTNGGLISTSRILNGLISGITLLLHKSLNPIFSALICVFFATSALIKPLTAEITKNSRYTPSHQDLNNTSIPTV